MRRLTGYLLPADDKLWEAWCCHIFAEVPGFESALPFRDPGMKQFGIDLIASRSDGKTVAVQCKLISGGEEFKDAKAETELEKTNGLTVELELLIFATTSKHRCLQEWAAKKNQGRPARNVKKIGVMSWPDFVALFNEHDHLVRKFYPHLIVEMTDGKPKNYEIIEIHVPLDDPRERGEIHLKVMGIATAHPGVPIIARDPSKPVR